MIDHLGALITALYLGGLAVAHNAGAALLLTIVVVLNFTVFQRHEIRAS